MLMCIEPMISHMLAKCFTLKYTLRPHAQIGTAKHVAIESNLCIPGSLMSALTFMQKPFLNLIKYERNNSTKLEQLWYDISGFCFCFEISTVLATLLLYGKLEVDMAIYVVWVPMVKEESLLNRCEYSLSSRFSLINEKCLFPKETRRCQMYF